MDLTQSRPIILCCGIGGWYAKGVERLERSLNFVGSPIPWKTWKDEMPPHSYPHSQFPYYFKVSAIQWAQEAGYTHVLLLDASFWAVKSPMPIFDIINDQGYYCFSSGYNLAQSVSDRALAAVNMSRDQAETFTEWATGAVGLRFDNPDGAALWSEWKRLMDLGLSKGSRNHDGQSADPRFLFHRQDQSCWSLAMAKLGLRNTQGTDHVAYWGPNHDPENVIFFINGI